VKIGPKRFDLGMTGQDRRVKKSQRWRDISSTWGVAPTEPICT